MSVGMKIAEKHYDVGVIVGRFQVHELHDAHLELIANVLARHEKVIIFLGLSPLMVTSRNPLDFEARKQMILEAFPKVNVLYIKDADSDEYWSKKLDEQVGDLVSPTQSVVMYGGRDSFIEHYVGKYPTQELTQERWISGTEQRRTISKSVKASPDFRAGVVWASANRYPTAYPTVDVAIFQDKQITANPDSYKRQILLVRKPHATHWRLPGGFASPDSVSYEADARREVHEEVGIEISDPKYVASMVIDDWRYRGENDKIKTLLFRAQYMYGRPEGKDDVAEARWFDWTDDIERVVVDEHKPLIHSLKA